MNPREIRKDFPILQNREVAYLDNAATTQKPDKVIEAVENFYTEKNANVGRGLYELAGDATMEYGGARKKVADFIGASRDEIIFVKNTTEAENFLASTLDFEGGIILSEMSHHSEQLPWRRKAEKEGKTIEYLETKDGKISLESAEEKITEETGLVAISHVSNVFGAQNPVKEIVKLAHDRDALVVLDAAQSVPHMPLDVEELGVDFLCFSGHKMLGPNGSGVLYGREDLLEDLEPYQVGGGMIKSVKKSSVEYESPPERFEAGTPDVAAAVGLKTAIEYLEGIGRKKVSEHTWRLSSKMVEELNSVEGVEVLSPKDATLVSFAAEWAHPHDVAEVLNQHGVAVRAGHHCAQPLMEELDVNGTTRASPYIYNTEEDVEKFLEAVREAKKVFSR